MPPLSAWLPAVSSRPASDLVLKIAGESFAGLSRGATALAAALAGQGLAVIVETARPREADQLPSARLRVATEPISSLGGGCDVLAHVAPRLFSRTLSGLQHGSVVLCEADTQPPAAPSEYLTGLVVYPIPFSELHRRCGSVPDGRELVAAGVLTHLLRIPPERVRSRVRPRGGIPCFEAGFSFAAGHLTKRDVNALPSPPSARPHLLLGAREAVLLALTNAGCTSRTTCLDELSASPELWLTVHVNQAARTVACRTSRHAPGVEIYRAADEPVSVWLGITDLDAPMEAARKSPSIVLVAADIPDLVRLIISSRRLARRGDVPVTIVAERWLMNRLQSLSAGVLADMLKRGAPGGLPHTDPVAPAVSPVGPLECDGEPGAEIGYVSWGVAQGVVREAVALCRTFGLKVAALYPKRIRPAPTEEVEAFAKTVRHLAVVEPDESTRYADLLKRRTALPFTCLRPHPGRRLTPMDMFMREDLGATHPIVGERSAMHETL